MKLKSLVAMAMVAAVFTSMPFAVSAKSNNSSNDNSKNGKPKVEVKLEVKVEAKTGEKAKVEVKTEEKAKAEVKTENKIASKESIKSDAVSTAAAITGKVVPNVRKIVKPVIKSSVLNKLNTIEKKIVTIGKDAQKIYLQVSAFTSGGALVVTTGPSVISTGSALGTSTGTAINTSGAAVNTSGSSIATSGSAVTTSGSAVTTGPALKLDKGPSAIGFINSTRNKLNALLNKVKEVEKELKALRIDKAANAKYISLVKKLSELKTGIAKEKALLDSLQKTLKKKDLEVVKLVME